jgi:O-methyltransferase
MALFRRAPRKMARLPALGPQAPNQVQGFAVPVFWGSRDPKALTDHMNAAIELVEPGYYFADNLFTWARSNSMLDDASFVRAWRANVESAADEAIVWRRYILACAAYHCVQLEGDFVECGAYTGVGVKTVVDYLGGTDFPKTFWAYDLFELPPDMAHHSGSEHGPMLESRVRNKFAAYPQVKVVKGPIPDVFASQSPATIAYLHIDLNAAAAEIAALEELFHRVVPGGVVVLDDYEWSFHRSQKMAEDRWFEARRYRVFPLPTGQGIVIKR